MKRYSYLIASLALLIAGCTKPDQPAQSSLSPTMTDEQILRAIGNDPSALSSHRDNGKDGYTMVYSNDTSLIFITRSAVSGVAVIRSKPDEKKQSWMLGKP